jgi:DNA modification methylase
MLIQGDNLPILRRLSDMKAEGKLLNGDGTPGVRLVYIDPPFASDEDYETRSGRIAYSDKIKGAEFIEGIRKRIVLLQDLLSSDAVIYIHMDWRKVHYIKAIMDELFGEHAFRNEVVWKRTNARTTADRWPRVHDVLLVYGVGNAPFAPETVPADSSRMPHNLITGADGLKYQTYELTAPGITRKGESGKPWRGFDPSSFSKHWANGLAVPEEWDRQRLIHWPTKGGFPRRRAAEPFREMDRTVPVSDVWTDIDRLYQGDKTRIYPTQKPEPLLRRIVESSTRIGDLVLDCFAGSQPLTCSIHCSIGPDQGRTPQPMIHGHIVGELNTGGRWRTVGPGLEIR